MRCPRCDGTDVGQIGFAFVESGLRFHYCRRCESRWWEHESSTVKLTEVLEAASVLARAS